MLPLTLACYRSSEPERDVVLLTAGNKFPEHLDGSMPGDAGFDPLSLGSDPELLKWCVFPSHALFVPLSRE